MTSIIAYTTTESFQLLVSAATICRVYEDDDQDYTFAASDIQFDLTDAEDVYDLVLAGVEVFIEIQDDDGSKFYGTLQQEGAEYDPETEIYTITALHISKKIFTALSTVPYPYGELPATMNFDINQLQAMTGCDIVVDPQAFAPFVIEGSALPATVPSTQYFVRDFLLDLAKHHRAIIHVADELSSDGKYQIVYTSEEVEEAVVHSGYDDLIAVYKEDSRGPQFDCVLFPCFLRYTYTGDNGWDWTKICYALYTPTGITLMNGFLEEDTLGMQVGLRNMQSDVTLQFLLPGDAVTVPDNCLDLRVPPGAYGDTFPATFPFGSIPTFVFNDNSSSWVGESPDDHCQRLYARQMLSFTEVTTQFSDEIPANPGESIIIRGTTLPIAEVDDDLVNVSSTIVGRRYS